MRMNLSMIDPKNSTVVEAKKVFHEAILDVEEGVAFWQALAESRPLKRRASPKYAHRDIRRRLQ